MRLIDNWRDVLRHSTALRILAVGAVLSGAEAALPFVNLALPLPNWAMGGLNFAVSGAAFWARLVAQRHLSGAGFDGRPSRVGARGSPDDDTTEYGDGS